MKVNLKKAFFTAATLATMVVSSQALASGSYDGGCARLTDAPTTARALDSVQAAEEPSAQQSSSEAAAPVVNDKIQQALMDHHTSPGAIDCDLESLAD